MWRIGWGIVLMRRSELLLFVCLLGLSFLAGGGRGKEKWKGEGERGLTGS